MGTIFMIIGIVVVIFWTFWLFTEKFPGIGDFISGVVTKAINYIKSLFHRKRTKNEERII